jgi:hypothetical protein
VVVVVFAKIANPIPVVLLPVPMLMTALIVAPGMTTMIQRRDG